MIDLKKYLELCHTLKKDLTEKDKDDMIEYNKNLISNYPFVKPRYSMFVEGEIADYDYTYTWMDDMPDGWRIAFGDELLNELKEELLKFEYTDEDKLSDNDTWLNHYQITQIKEKYGELRWYDAGVPSGKSRTFFDFLDLGGTAVVGDTNTECKVWDIIDKYSRLSRKICVNCGKPATWISTGWICPWCDDCKDLTTDKFVSVGEFFKEENENED